MCAWRACVRVCVCVCMRVCVRSYLSILRLQVVGGVQGSQGGAAHRLLLQQQLQQQHQPV